MIVVQAVPGREDYTRATCWALDSIGGASTVDPRPLLYWTAPDPPTFDLPPGWALVHSKREREGHRKDLWRIMGTVPEGEDLIVFEDDVIPCRNAVAYMARWQSSLFTTFFNMRQPGEGPHPVHPVFGFWGTQAFKAPARLVRQFLSAGDTDTTAPSFQNDGGDSWIGKLLRRWGEPIYYHRSLVQHVGQRSVHRPHAKLKGLRAPARDFDPELDALTL